MRWMLVLAMLMVCGCGGLPMPDPGAFEREQPRVLTIAPSDGEIAGADAAIAVEFSRPVEPTSITTHTLAVVAQGESSAIDEIIEDVVDGDVGGIAGTYMIEGEGQIVQFRSDAPLVAGTTYLVIATSGILSTELLPLSQRPDGAPDPFVSVFTVSAVAGVPGGGSPSESDGGGGSDGASGGGSEGEGSAPVARNRPSQLLLNELLYDVPGSDTDGEVFVELVGEAGGDITGFQVLLINGPDGAIKDTITLPDDAIIPADGIYLIADARTGSKGTTNVPNADFVDTFDPQNGPDCVQLLDQNGALLDALGYGEPLIDAAENGHPCHEGTPAMKAVSGQSLSRMGGTDTDDNFLDFTFLDIPTPGEI